VGCDLQEKCSFTACITLDTEADGCGKIDHWCDKSDENSCPNHGGLWDNEPKRNGHGDKHASHNVQCQTGGPGEELKFIYKDGRGCDHGVDENTESWMLVEDGIAYTVSCAPSTLDVSVSSIRFTAGPHMDIFC